MCEAFGMRCEIHVSGFGSMQILGATNEDVCEYYERGLLGPGVRYQIRWDYIDEHRLPDTPVEPVAPLHPS